jgi:hypothetical protein
VQADESAGALGPKFYCVKRRLSITSKYWHIYGVLNVDEIKN